MKWKIDRANLDPVIGSEQGKSRPVIVISEDGVNALLPVVDILPVTSRKPGLKVYPNEALLDAGKFGLPNESLVLCYQIRALDKRRLSTEYGEVTGPLKRDEILDALCFQLGIQRIV